MTKQRYQLDWYMLCITKLNITRDEAKRRRIQEKICRLHRELKQSLQEETSDSEVSEEENIDFRHDLNVASPASAAPTIEWADDGQATCQRCGFSWDGDAQHRC